MSTIYDNMGNGSEDKSALDEVFGRSAISMRNLW